MSTSLITPSLLRRERRIGNHTTTTAQQQEALDSHFRVLSIQEIQISFLPRGGGHRSWRTPTTATHGTMVDNSGGSINNGSTPQQLLQCCAGKRRRETVSEVLHNLDEGSSSSCYSLTNLVKELVFRQTDPRSLCPSCRQNESAGGDTATRAAAATSASSGRSSNSRFPSSSPRPQQPPAAGGAMLFDLIDYTVDDIRRLTSFLTQLCDKLQEGETAEDDDDGNNSNTNKENGGNENHTKQKISSKTMDRKTRVSIFPIYIIVSRSKLTIVYGLPTDDSKREFQALMDTAFLNKRDLLVEENTAAGSSCVILTYPTPSEVLPATMNVIVRDTMKLLSLPDTLDGRDTARSIILRKMKDKRANVRRGRSSKRTKVPAAVVASPSSHIFYNPVLTNFLVDLLLRRGPPRHLRP